MTKIHLRALLFALVSPVAAQAPAPAPVRPVSDKLVGAEVRVLVASKRLEVGDQAPPLRDLAWLAGRPVEIGDDKIVVVEFFTTFCSLCRLSIPILTKLQRLYPDSVRIAGVVPARFERKRKNVDSLVAAWEQRIGYAIAWDADDRATQDWFDAAGQTGYPVAFVVDAKSRIAWIGSPLDGLEDVLARVVSGKFDVAIAQQVGRLQSSLSRAQRTGDRNAVLDLSGKWIAIEPTRATPWISRFTALADDFTAAAAALECTRDALRHLSAAPAELARFANEGLFAVADVPECHALGLQTVREAFAAADNDPQLAVAYFSALAATGKDSEAEKVASKAVDLARSDKVALVALARHFIERRHGKRFVAAALTAIRHASALEPDNHQLDLMEFGILADVAGDDEAARAVGQRIVTKAKGDEVLLNDFAWDLLDKPKLGGRFDALALAAAQATQALPNGGHWMYVDTLARAQFVNGNLDEAVKLQRRALKDCDNAMYLRQIHDRLKTYEKAVAAKRR